LQTSSRFQSINSAFQSRAAGLACSCARAIYQQLENAMSKGMDSKKTKKKEPLKTPKEKKADKKAKKDGK